MAARARPRLGKVFSSVITGNLALLGVAGGQQDATLSLNAGLALAGYARRPRPDRHRLGPRGIHRPRDLLRSRRPQI